MTFKQALAYIIYLDWQFQCHNRSHTNIRPRWNVHRRKYLLARQIRNYPRTLGVPIADAINMELI